MNKKQLSKEISKCLQLADFEPNVLKAGAISLVRETDNEKDEIIISYNKYPGVFNLSPVITGRKTIKAVDYILKKYFSKSKIGYQEHTIHANSRRCDELNQFDITGEEDVKEISEKLAQMTKEDIMPFLTKYNSPEKINVKLDHLKVADLAKFITNPPHPRIMVIKRLANSQDWRSYCEESIKIYREQAQGKYKKVFAPIYDFLPELYKELRNLEMNQSA